MTAESALLLGKWKSKHEILASIYTRLTGEMVGGAVPEEQQESKSASQTASSDSAPEPSAPAGQSDETDGTGEKASGEVQVEDADGSTGPVDSPPPEKEDSEPVSATQTGEAEDGSTDPPTGSLSSEAGKAGEEASPKSSGETSSPQAASDSGDDGSDSPTEEKGAAEGDDAKSDAGMFSKLTETFKNTFQSSSPKSSQGPDNKLSGASEKAEESPPDEDKEIPPLSTNEPPDNSGKQQTLGAVESSPREAKMEKQQDAAASTAVITELAEEMGKKRETERILKEQLVKQQAEMAVQTQTAKAERLQAKNDSLQAQLKETQEKNEQLRVKMEEALQQRAEAEQKEALEKTDATELAKRKDRSEKFLDLMRVADTSPLVDAVLRASNGGLPVAVDLKSVNEVWGPKDASRTYALSAATEQGGTALFEKLCTGSSPADAKKLQQLETNLGSALSFAQAVQNSFDSTSPVVPTIPEVSNFGFEGSGGTAVRSAVVPAAFYAAGIGDLPTADSWERVFTQRCAVLFRRKAAFNAIAISGPAEEALELVKRLAKTNEEGYEPQSSTSVAEVTADLQDTLTTATVDAYKSAGEAVTDTVNSVIDTFTS